MVEIVVQCIKSGMGENCRFIKCPLLYLCFPEYYEKVNNDLQNLQKYETENNTKSG